jgi:ABC-2 type transport system permease protein
MVTYWRALMAGVRASWAMYAVELTPATFFGGKVPRNVLQALFFVLLAMAAGGDELARFSMIGNSVNAAMFMVIIFMSSVIELEKWAGTLQNLIAAPTHWLPLLVGRSFATVVDALFGSAIVFSILLPVLDLGIEVIHLLRAVPFILLTVVTCGAMGWMIGAASLPIRWGTLIANVVAYTMMIVSGVNFPTEALPPFLFWLGRVLPFTHGLKAIRLVIDGGSYMEALPWMGIELGIGLVYGIVAWLIFGVRLQAVRRRGTLELF